VKATGQIAETPLVHVFTIQGGKVTWFFEMFDTAKAERAYRKAAAAAGATGFGMTPRAAREGGLSPLAFN
jgi:hypothetical protein